MSSKLLTFHICACRPRRIRASRMCCKRTAEFTVSRSMYIYSCRGLSCRSIYNDLCVQSDGRQALHTCTKNRPVVPENQQLVLVLASNRTKTIRYWCVDYSHGYLLMHSSFGPVFVDALINTLALYLLMYQSTTFFFMHQQKYPSSQCIKPRDIACC